MADQLCGKTIAFLATEGVEQVELTGLLDGLVEEFAEGKHARQASSVA